MVRYVYLEPCPAVQHEGRATCKATFYPDPSSGKPSEIRSVYARGGIAYKNWTPYHSFCMDVQNPQDVPIPLKIELRSGAAAFSKTFDLPPAAWTTVAISLSEAARQIKLSEVSDLRIIEPPESVKAPNVLHLGRRV